MWFLLADLYVLLSCMDSTLLLPPLTGGERKSIKHEYNTYLQYVIGCKFSIDHSLPGTVSTFKFMLTHVPIYL